jgi:hypothetical protein
MQPNLFSECKKCLSKPAKKAKAALLPPRKRKNDGGSKSTIFKKARMNEVDESNDATMPPSLPVAVPQPSARSCRTIVRTEEEEEALHNDIEVIGGTAETAKMSIGKSTKNTTAETAADEPESAEDELSKFKCYNIKLVLITSRKINEGVDVTCLCLL